MYIRKDGTNRVVGVMEKGGGYAPVIFKLKRNRDGHVTPVTLDDLTTVEKADFYRLVVKKELSTTPLQRDRKGNRIVIAAQVEGEDAMTPAFVSEEGSPVLVDKQALAEKELAAYRKLLKEKGIAPH